MGQNLLFYTAAGSVVGVVMQFAGFGLGTVMFGSFILPPILLIGWRIWKIKGSS